MPVRQEAPEQCQAPDNLSEQVPAIVTTRPGDQQVGQLADMLKPSIGWQAGAARRL